MGAARPALGRRHGRLQPRRHRRRTHRGTGGTGRLRGLRPRDRRRPAAPPGGPQAPAGGPVRGVARGRRGVDRPGVGPQRHGGNRLLGVCARRRGRLRGARPAGAATPGTAPAVRDRVRARRGRVGGGWADHGRRGLAARAGPHGGARPAVAGGGGHGRRVRVLVHGHATDRRGARHALLRPDPGRRGLHRPVGRNGCVRGRTGRGKRARGRRSGTRFRCPAPTVPRSRDGGFGPLSGCRRE